MIRSIDILNRNFEALRTKQKNLSANAANITTPGYKFQRLIQRTLESETMINHAGGEHGNQLQELGEFTFGNQLDEAMIDFSEGTLQHTGLPTDFAISGDGFFTVQGPNGVLFTQNGQFTINDAGQLVTAEGYVVQTTAPVTFNQYTQVDEKGYIDGTTNRLLITSFGEAVTNLTAVDNGYFTGAGGVNGDFGTIYQGYLETSNLEMADLMIEMMQITREYEANQKVLHAADETLQKANNQIGKV